MDLFLTISWMNGRNAANMIGMRTVRSLASQDENKHPDEYTTTSSSSSSSSASPSPQPDGELLPGSEPAAELLPYRQIVFQKVRGRMKEEEMKSSVKAVDAGLGSSSSSSSSSKNRRGKESSTCGSGPKETVFLTVRFTTGSPSLLHLSPFSLPP